MNLHCALNNLNYGGMVLTDYSFYELDLLNIKTLTLDQEYF